MTAPVEVHDSSRHAGELERVGVDRRFVPVSILTVQYAPIARRASGFHGLRVSRAGPRSQRAVALEGARRCVYEAQTLELLRQKSHASGRPDHFAGFPGDPRDHSRRLSCCRSAPLATARRCASRSSKSDRWILFDGILPPHVRDEAVEPRVLFVQQLPSFLRTRKSCSA